MAKEREKPELRHEPTIYEAELQSGASGAVLRGQELDKDAAVSQRAEGKDVVVCSNDVDANRRLAREIEEAVGPSERHPPHEDAGPGALPHFQPRKRRRAGHTFYETER